MRIAYLCHSPIPSNVASSIHVMRMCQAFAHDHDVTLFCPSLPKVRSAPDKVRDFYGVQAPFEIRRLPRPQSWADRAVPAGRLFRWWAALGRFDLVYARCNAWSTYRLHRLRRPMIVEAHLLHRQRGTEKLLRSPWVRGLVVISEVLQRDYANAYDLPGLKVLVAHDGADPACSGSPARLPGSNPLRCGYVGNLYRGKGIEIVIPLAQRCPQIDFHVFGGTPDEVADWRARIGAGEVVNLWFHGSVRPADTDAARLACDLLIAPYQKVVHGAGDKGDLGRWMSPLKIFEYMAAGKAIIASDVPTLREVLHHRENAVLVPPEDLDAWAAAIRDLAADPAGRQRLGARARADFVARHSWQTRARRIMAAFVASESRAGTSDRPARPINVQRALR